MFIYKYKTVSSTNKLKGTTGTGIDVEDSVRKIWSLYHTMVVIFEQKCMAGKK